VTVSGPRLDPARYAPHRLHAAERVWPETNCYTDLWIQLLHRLELEPVAGLAFTLGVDFEGDQWTFFKYPPGDLYVLYGVDVRELNVWRPLVEHVEEQVCAGRLLIVDVDAFFLPDTAGVTYRAEHAKTSIAIQAIEVPARRIGYFHNAGYHGLEGADFAGVLGLDTRAGDAAVLPPYVEMVKLDTCRRLPAGALVARAAELARMHYARRPVRNPFARFRRRLVDDVKWLRGQNLATFHRYAFGTLRQCGAGFELAAVFLRWLEDGVRGGLGPAARQLEEIAQGAKSLQFTLARTVATGRAVEVDPLLDTMEGAWAGAMDRLGAWCRSAAPPS
jgi:uncharacterized protein DUF1839